MITTKIQGEHERKIKLFEIPAGLTADEVNAACASIKSEILASCGVADSDLLLDARTTDEGKIALNFDLMKKEKFDCVVEAMQHALKRVPEITTTVLAPLVLSLVQEKRKRQFPPG